MHKAGKVSSAPAADRGPTERSAPDQGAANCRVLGASERGIALSLPRAPPALAQAGASTDLLQFATHKI
jgi:hypothetical protein